MSQPNPWAVTELDPNLVVRLASMIPPCDRAVELDVDLVGDPHQEDDAGHVWTRLSAARQVADVAPGAVVLLGSAIGRYLATVLPGTSRSTPTTRLSSSTSCRSARAP